MENKKRYTGIQPQYFPRLHYFARILNTDTFVLRDDAQFVKKHKYPDGTTGPSYQAHSPIKSSSGLYLLQVPFIHDGLKPIAETEISYADNWQELHLKTLQSMYGKAPNFSKIFPEIERIITKRCDSISELSITTAMWGLLRLLGVNEVASEMLTIKNVTKRLENQSVFRLRAIRKGSESKAMNTEGLTPSDKIIQLMKEVGATVDYCGGTGVAAYLDVKDLERNGMEILVQDWKCNEYFQLFPKQGFIPNLSIIDLLMNVSTKEAVSIINDNS